MYTCPRAIEICSPGRPMIRFTYNTCGPASLIAMMSPRAGFLYWYASRLTRFSDPDRYVGSMLMPSARIGISTHRKMMKLNVARTRTRTAVRRGSRPNTRRRVRLTPEPGCTLECSMFNVFVFQTLDEHRHRPVSRMEHQELNIEDTRSTRETPDYKFVPSPLLKAEAQCRMGEVHSAISMQQSHFGFRFEYAA